MFAACSNPSGHDGLPDDFSIVVSQSTTVDIEPDGSASPVFDWSDVAFATLTI